MKVSVFRSITELAPFLHELDWEQLTGLLSTFEEGFQNKKQLPLFSPGEFVGPRAAKNVTRVHFGVMDLDDIPTDQFLALVERFRDQGKALHWYSSWSHYKAEERGLVRARVVVPFSRPVESFEWADTWGKLYAQLDGLPDPQCKDVSRGYFFPANPPGFEGRGLYGTTVGAPFDVDQQTLALVIPTKKKPFGYPQLKAMLANLKRAKTDKKRWLRDKVEALVAGESLAEPGERDTTVWSLVCAILDEYPEADPTKLAACFGPSLAIMEREAPGAPTVESVLGKIERKQAEKEATLVVEKTTGLEERRRRIRLAFGYSPRDTPYTQEELVGFTKTLGLPSQEYLKNHWILQKDQSYYLLLSGSYQGPFTWAELEKAAQTILAPAYTAGVEVYKPNQWGELTPKSAKELVEEYGSLVREIVVDLSAEKASFNIRTGTLVEAPCPPRITTPEYNPDIARWLELLGGETHHKLLDWLSVVTRIDVPCAALYIEGAKGVGKSLLAEGISRIWTDQGPAPLVDVMAQFNATATRCPLVFADEAVPKDLKGQSRTGELRQIIQARTRTLNRKYLAPATLRGCIRLILAANNADLLNSSEHLTVNDIEAIVDRVVHLDASTAKAAQEFLDSLPPGTTMAWVEEGIAKHCLWLRDNHTIQGHHRFLVSGDKSALHRRLTVSSGIRSAVCCWLVGYLIQPTKVDITKKLLVRVYKGNLLVNVRSIADMWELYPTNTKAPPVGEIAKALVGISKRDTVQLTDGTGTKTHYRVVDRDNLIAWATDYGYATAEALVAALEKDTQK